MNELSGVIKLNTRAHRYRWGRNIEWHVGNLVNGNPCITLNIANQKAVLEPKYALQLVNVLVQFMEKVDAR